MLKSRYNKFFGKNVLLTHRLAEWYTNQKDKDNQKHAYILLASVKISEARGRATPLITQSTGNSYRIEDDSWRTSASWQVIVTATTKWINGQHSLQLSETREQEVSKWFCGTTAVLNSIVGIQILAFVLENWKWQKRSHHEKNLRVKKKKFL